jgi:DNA-binding CsgD family transcriptional regulator
MFYKELAGIANQINQSQSDIDGILQMFCMRKVADHKFLAAFYLQVEKDGRLHLLSFYGAEPSDVGLPGDSISIFEDHPVADAVRSGQTSWSKSQLAKNRAGSLVAWPVISDERVFGVLLALYEVPFSESEHDLEYFDAIATIIGGAIIKQSQTSPSIGSSRRGLSLPIKLNKAEFSERELTQRQQLVLKLIAEGRTNGDIADILGYSESLIRQETIRIYAILGCSGRNEAARLYREKEKLVASGAKK